MEFCGVLLTFKSVDVILQCDHSNEISLAVFSHGTVYYAAKGGTHFGVWTKIVQCDHSNESYWAVLFNTCGTVYYAVQGGSNFWDRGQKLCGVTTQIKAILSNTFLWYCLLCCTRWFYFLSLWMKCLSGSHSNESYWAALSCGTDFYAVQGGSNFGVCGQKLQCDHSNESYLAVLNCSVLFIMLYKVVLTFKSVDIILQCDHSNEISWAVFSHGTSYSVNSSIFYVCVHNPKYEKFTWNHFSSNFTWCYLLLTIL